MKITAAVYAIISLFCGVVFIVYDRFSHDVRSPYMTFLFAIPLVFGVVPAVILAVKKDIRRPGRAAFNIYNAGVAALTVSSLLRGIFEIAGTGSPYQRYLGVFGIVLLASGAAMHILSGRTIIRTGC